MILAKKVEGYLFAIFFVLVTIIVAVPGDASQDIYESFETMENWSPFTFDGIDEHSSYRVTEAEGISCLEMTAAGGASALILDSRFDVYDLPVLSWRWKVDTVFSKGDYSKKSGDDYPARLYVMFAYDPESASWGKQLKYGTAKLIYGEYPPDSTLNYIWANRGDAPEVITNVYVDQAKMLPVDRGNTNLDQWREYQVNIVADYQKAFGKKPPRTAALAIMIDSDNTGEIGRSCLDFVRLSAGDEL